MWADMMQHLESWFKYPYNEWGMTLIGIGLGIAFGAFWLVGHWPPLFRKHWLWGIAVVSAFLTLLAIVFVQIPLQTWAGDAIRHFWTQAVITDWLFLLAIPQILVSGLVQEGAKMVPMVLWWWRSSTNITPRLGMAIGAVAGAGFGIFEAVWVHLKVFNAGWTWQAYQTDGFIAIAGFWERFFSVGFHIAASALVGYGLAKGNGWQFYLIAAGLHALFNYIVVFYQKGMLTIVQVETYVAVFAVIITAVVFWLNRTRRGEEEINGDDSGIYEGTKEEIAAGQTVEKLISKRVVDEDENNGIEN